MGRIVTYLTILIVMDLLFIITGQLCADGICSFTSVIFSAVVNPSIILTSDFYLQIIGSPLALIGGLASVGFLGFLIQQITTGGVAIGSLISGLKNDSILFAPAGVALSLLTTDFINIYTYIYSSSPITALLIFSPITIIYVFTCLEWVRGMP